MKIEELFHRLLGLEKSWEVESCEYAEELNSFFIMVRENGVHLDDQQPRSELADKWWTGQRIP